MLVQLQLNIAAVGLIYYCSHVNCRNEDGTIIFLLDFIVDQQFNVCKKLIVVDDYIIIIILIVFIMFIIRATYSWRWALLEKPKIVQLLKNFPAFYGTRRFITVFTRALHWSLSWARSIQFMSFSLRLICLSEESVQVWGFLWSFVTSLFFTSGSC
jgi:hypothetical protein